MKIFLIWIKKHKTSTIVILIVMFAIPMLIIHCLFKLTAPCDWLVADWTSGDVLAYYGTFLSFIGMVILGIVAVWQNEQANSTNIRLLELERRRQQPCFDIINNQKYFLYFGDEIEKFKERNDLNSVLKMEPLYILSPRSGIQISVALMDIEITNSGNTDIRNIFIKDMKAFLGIGAPKEQQRPLWVSGNTLIKVGKKYRLLIDFQQELSEESDDINSQIQWVYKNRLLMPRLELKLHLIAIDGYEYDENIVLDSGYHVRLKNERNILERTLHVSKIEICEHSNEYNCND